MSKEYVPDRWLLVEMEIDGKPMRKVFGTWSGGYLDGDSWRMSSGVESVEEHDNYYLFKNYSGSVYKCRKKGSGTTSYGSAVLNSMKINLKEKEGVDLKIIDEANI